MTSPSGTPAISINRTPPSNINFADLSTTPGGTIYSTTPGGTSCPQFFFSKFTMKSLQKHLKGTRIVYDRSALLFLRNSPLAMTPPKNLAHIPGITKAPAPKVLDPNHFTPSTSAAHDVSPNRHRSSSNQQPNTTLKIVSNTKMMVRDHSPKDRFGKTGSFNPFQSGRGFVQHGLNSSSFPLQCWRKKS